MREDFDRDTNERLAWFPTLHRLGFRRLELSKDAVDQIEACDVKAEIRFALRVRAATDLPDYLEQFTIRWLRPSGVPTEKDKMLEGADYPDYKGYGFRATDGLEPWVVLRVVNLRRLHRSGELDAAKVAEKRNYDKRGSTFRIFSLPKLVRADPDLVYKSSPNHPGIPAIQTPVPQRHQLLPRQLKLTRQP